MFINADFPSGLPRSKTQSKVFFGHEPSAELIAILTVYFVQGASWGWLPSHQLFLKIALSPAQVSAVWHCCLPWIIKPVFGFMSDGLPLFGYRRRPYLVLSGYWEQSPG